MLPNDMREILEFFYQHRKMTNFIRRIYNEEEEIRQLITKQRFPYANMRVSDPFVKVIALIQSHFSRLSIASVNLAANVSEVILLLDKLLIGLMKVISRKRLLLLFIRAMEIISMIIQAMWHDDFILLQVSYLKRDLVDKCREKNIQNFNDLKTMGRHNASKLLGFTTSHRLDINHIMKYNHFSMNYHARVDIVPGWMQWL